MILFVSIIWIKDTEGSEFSLIGKRLKELRGSRTQQEIADLLNISRARYSHYENEIREPDNEMLQKLADIYNVSVDYILGKDSDDEKTADKSAKDEKDIAKRLQKFKEEIENSDGLAFSGEPLSEEAKESLIESMEYIFRQTQKINKKYVPKKFRDEED